MKSVAFVDNELLGRACASDYEASVCTFASTGIKNTGKRSLVSTSICVEFMDHLEGSLSRSP
jgi:hypothetical protein